MRATTQSHISDSGCTALAAGLQSNNVLEELHCSGAHGRVQANFGMSHVTWYWYLSTLSADCPHSRPLPVHRELVRREFVSSDTSTSEIGWTALVESMKTKKPVKHLEFSGARR